MILFSLFSAGCPYQLVREGEVSLPGGIKSLAIPLAQNQTIEAGLDDMFTQELIKRFRSDGRVLILEPGMADAELRCQLLELKISPVGYTREGRVRAESAALSVECGLVAPSSGYRLWKTRRLTAAEEYPVGDDYLANEDQKARALLEVCRDLSETVRSLLLDSF